MVELLQLKDDSIQELQGNYQITCNVLQNDIGYLVRALFLPDQQHVSDLLYWLVVAAVATSFLDAPGDRRSADRSSQTGPVIQFADERPRSLDAEARLHLSHLGFID